MKTKTYTLTKCYGGHYLAESKRYFFYIGRDRLGNYWAETTGLNSSDNPKKPKRIPEELIAAIERVKCAERERHYMHRLDD